MGRAEAAGLLLTEGLGACARIAVESRVSEASYLSLARSLYRRLAPARPGPVAASHGEWDPLLRACGGQTALARALGVSRLTVVRWVTGQRVPGESDTRAIRAAAKKRGVTAPL